MSGGITIWRFVSLPSQHSMIRFQLSEIISSMADALSWGPLWEHARILAINFSLNRSFSITAPEKVYSLGTHSARERGDNPETWKLIQSFEI